MASKINAAIKRYLAFIRPVDESEIVDEVQKFSKAKTLHSRERGINRNLNALWKKGELEKYYLDDNDNLVKMKLDEKNTLPKIWQLIKKPYLRKEISIDVYCGKYPERRKRIDLKVWTFEDNTDSQEDFLKEKVIEILEADYKDCYSPQKEADEYADDLDVSDLDNYAYDVYGGRTDNYAYDDSQKIDDPNPDEIFPQWDHHEA